MLRGWNDASAGIPDVWGKLLTCVVTPTQVFNPVTFVKITDRVNAYADAVERLSYSIERLASAEDEVLGSDYVKNIRDRVSATEKLLAMTERQMQVEKNHQGR